VTLKAIKKEKSETLNTNKEETKIKGRYGKYLKEIIKTDREIRKIVKSID